MDIGEDVVEFLGRAIHDRYVAERIRAGESVAHNAAMVGWEELAEDFRQANLELARDVGRKLALIGCRLEQRTGRAATLVRLAAAEIELLAEREHERWLAERARRGWSYAARRDNAARLHPDMVAWSQLDEAARDKDRGPIAVLPEILAAAGMEIVRAG